MGIAASPDAGKDIFYGIGRVARSVLPGFFGRAHSFLAAKFLDIRCIAEVSARADKPVPSAS
jgi:hypothetical protein